MIEKSIEIKYFKEEEEKKRKSINFYLIIMEVKIRKQKSLKIQ